MFLHKWIKQVCGTFEYILWNSDKYSTRVHFFYWLLQIGKSLWKKQLPYWLYCTHTHTHTHRRHTCACDCFHGKKTNMGGVTLLVKSEQTLGWSSARFWVNHVPSFAEAGFHGKWRRKRRLSVNDRRWMLILQQSIEQSSHKQTTYKVSECVGGKQNKFHLWNRVFVFSFFTKEEMFCLASSCNRAAVTRHHKKGTELPTLERRSLQFSVEQKEPSTTERNDSCHQCDWGSHTLVSSSLANLCQTLATRRATQLWKKEFEQRSAPTEKSYISRLLLNLEIEHLKVYHFVKRK